MKKVTQKKWNECLSCYKSNKKGKKFMLLNEKNYTNWVEVKVINLK